MEGAGGRGGGGAEVEICPRVQRGRCENRPSLRGRIYSGISLLNDTCVRYPCPRGGGYFYAPPPP